MRVISSYLELNKVTIGYFMQNEVNDDNLDKLGLTSQMALGATPGATIFLHRIATFQISAPVSRRPKRFRRSPTTEIVKKNRRIVHTPKIVEMSPETVTRGDTWSKPPALMAERANTVVMMKKTTQSKYTQTKYD